MTKDSGVPFYKNRFAFTLIETIFSLVVLAVLVATGGRLLLSSEDSRAFQETVRRMYLIRDKIIGDQRIIQCGHRVDYGYFGKHGAFPPKYDPPSSYGFETLSSVWPTPNPYLRAHDGWGNRLDLDYDPDDATLAIVSGGANASVNAADTGFNTDISMGIKKADYDSASVYLFCKDVRGTLLLGIRPLLPATYNNPIWHVEMTFNGGATRAFPDGTLAYNATHYWYGTGVNVGQVKISVYPADGVTDAGAQKYCSTNRLPELLSNSMPAVTYYEMINPAGGDTSINYGGANIIEVRFPGAIGDLHS